MVIHPKKLVGAWLDGRALDFHTVSSTYVGDDEFGNPRYETVRTAIGELLYRLKYQGDEAAVEPLARAAATYVRTWNCRPDILVPVPPSRTRVKQPVRMVGRRIADLLGIPFVPDCVNRIRTVPELKDVTDTRKRSRLLRGAHQVLTQKSRNRRILLFDDLFRSGATMNSIATLLSQDGAAAAVLALTLTRTRSNR